jgi:hypothetical protein
MPVFEDDEIGIVPTISKGTVDILDVRGLKQRYLVELPKVLDRNFKAIIRALRALRDANTTPPFEFHRGITAAALTKNVAGNVSRYTAGTTTLSGDTDSVISEFRGIAIGKKVSYIKSGDNYYLLDSDKVQTEVMTDLRHTTGNTQIEGEAVVTWLDTVASPAFENKITVNPC